VDRNTTIRALIAVAIMIQFVNLMYILIFINNISNNSIQLAGKTVIYTTNSDIMNFFMTELFMLMLPMIFVGMAGQVATGSINLQRKEINEAKNLIPCMCCECCKCKENVDSSSS